ncbi:MAG: DUF6714 family protein [Myxococcota bacterium]
MKHPCPICGHRTLQHPLGTARQLCPVCAWEEYEAMDLNSSPIYDVDLSTLQNTYASCGAWDRELVAFTRPPRADEAPPSWWRPYTAQAGHIADQLQRAFAKTSLGGGLSMMDAREIDLYGAAGLEPGEQPFPAGHPDGSPWPWERLEDVLTGSWIMGSLMFLDAGGVRYYLPALAVAFLRSPEPFSKDAQMRVAFSPFAECLSWLTSPERSAGLQDILTPPQQRAIAGLLSWLMTPRSGNLFFDNAETAMHGAGWDAFLPDTQRAYLTLPA